MGIKRWIGHTPQIVQPLLPPKFACGSYTATARYYHSVKKGNVEWRPVCSPLEVVAETEAAEASNGADLDGPVKRDGPEFRPRKRT